MTALLLPFITANSYCIWVVDSANSKLLLTENEVSVDGENCIDSNVRDNNSL